MLKVYSDGLKSYKPWSGAVYTYEIIEREDKVENLEMLLEELYPEGMTETQVNDILWFEPEFVFESLGIKNPYDEDEDEDEEEEED